MTDKGWVQRTTAVVIRGRRLASLICAALSFGFAGVTDAGVIRIERVTGPMVAGGTEAEIAFVDAMQLWAGNGVSYGLAGGTGNIWTLTQDVNPGAVLSPFDTVIGHIGQSLPLHTDVTALIGYGSVDPARYTGVLIDVFQPGGNAGVQLFDMQDILLFPAASPNVPNQAGLILHGLYELYTSVLGVGNGYDLSHGNALAQENNVSALLGGPLSRGDRLGQAWIGPGTIPVANPFGDLAANEWAAPFDVTHAGGAGKVWLKGIGNAANLTDVLPGGFASGADPYRLPSEGGDIRLVEVAFLSVPEPGSLGSTSIALFALLVARRLTKTCRGI